MAITDNLKQYFRKRKNKVIAVTLGVVLSVFLLMPTLATESNPSDSTPASIMLPDIDPWLKGLGALVTALGAWAIADKRQFQQWQAKIEGQASDRIRETNARFEAYTDKLEIELDQVRAENRELYQKVAKIEGQLAIMVTERNRLELENRTLVEKNLSLQQHILRIRSGDDLGDSFG